MVIILKINNEKSATFKRINADFITKYDMPKLLGGNFHLGIQYGICLRRF